MTTQASAKGAASTKRWVVATFLGGDWCFENLPVRVVSEECGTVGCFDFFERLSKVMSEPLGWS